MESTLNASESAAWALEEIRTGRSSIVVGRRPDKKKNKNRPWMTYVIALLIIAMIIWMIAPRPATVSLRVRNRRQAAMTNTEIVLRSDNGTNHTCRTDRYGEAEITIPKGKYRIYRIEGDRKIPSPTSLKCNENMSVTAYFDAP